MKKNLHFISKRLKSVKKTQKKIKDISLLFMPME